jgi:hypothetical protein
MSSSSLDQSGLTSPNPSVDPSSKRRRKPLSCEPCRHSKLRCDRQLPCATCLKRGWQDQCAYGPVANANANANSDSTGSPRRQRRTRHSSARAVVSRPQDQGQNNHDQDRSQQPQVQLPTPPDPVPIRDQSPEPIQHRWDTILRRPPIVEKCRTNWINGVSFTMSFGPSMPTPDLLRMLPPDAVCEYLVSHYFAHLCSLFRVLHGPTFQKQYSAFLQDRQQADLSFLALLFAICSLTVKTIPDPDPGLMEMWREDQPLPRDISSLAQKYRDAALMCLAQDQFLVRHSLKTLETLLVIIHTISDSEGAEFGWALLGNALHIAIALGCHTNRVESNCITRERRRRCWAGVVILHTYQALLFRDTDLSFLCNMKAPMPADANDADIRDDAILTQPETRIPGAAPTQMSLMRFKIRLFHLSTDICNFITGPDRLKEEAMVRLDSRVQAEQQEWDALYLVDGVRSILDTAGYAHWCILQTYAYQLYLLLHRPFHSSRSSNFRAESRDKCVKSSMGLMDIHRQFYELPRLKAYRWLVHGTISCNALHGAVALTSCVLEMPRGSEEFSSYVAALDATVHRLKALQRSSPACASIYPIICHLQ